MTTDASDNTIRTAIVIDCSSPDTFLRLQGMIEFLNDDGAEIISADDWRQQEDPAVPAAALVCSDLGKKSYERSVASFVALATPVIVFPTEGSPAPTVPADAKATSLVAAIKCPTAFEDMQSALELLSALRAGTAGNRAAGPGKIDLVGDSAEIRMIRRLVAQVAPKDTSVLITGESGTGKEVVARLIHKQSGRKGKFIAINCCAIPEHLLESELFGHVRGAFTGAEAARTGRFEAADGGTLFLDEIGDMPKALQVKLLRVLQERCIERVGSTETKHVDVRIIAATHRDLAQRIEQGSFREDLYYRLSVFPIEIPALRERPDDIAPLIDDIAARIRLTHNVSLKLTDDATRCLAQYAWPGNVRELINYLERLAVIGGHSEILPEDLPAPVGTARPQEAANTAGSTFLLPEGGIVLKDHLARIENDAIQDALTRSEGIVQGAADLLGLGRTTLVEKIKRYGIALEAR